MRNARKGREVVRAVMLRKASKPRGPNRFRKREARRLFEAGAERVEFDPVTGRLIGYRHATETRASPKSSWDEILTDAADQDRAT
jgi:hypothetical protein